MPRGIPNNRAAEEIEQSTTSTVIDLDGDREEIFSADAAGMSEEAMQAAAVKEYADLLAFMAEFVTVVVHDTSDPNADLLPMVSVNGRPQFFVRGQEQRVRRYYVEGLERSKVDSISPGAQFKLMALGEEPRQFVNKTRAPKYPYSVIRDDNPRGADWLRKLKQEDRLNG